jgi:GAF domain-containing protein/HAMP domain-containing protein
MNKPPSHSSRANRLLAKTGGFYLLLVILLGQLASSSLGIAVASQLVAMNAGMTTAQLSRLAVAAGIIMLVRNMLLLVYAYFLNRATFSRLNKWARGVPLESGTDEEQQAWRQITSISWRYIGISLTSLVFFAAPLALAYLYYVLGGTVDQVIYTLIAIFVAGLSNAILEVLFIERLMTNARLVLLPQGFDAQVAGVTGIRMLTKFQVAFFALILVSILLVAPIGYHQTTTVLYEEIGSQKVLLDLQVQSFVVGAFSLLLGFGISFALTRAISQPIRQMIDTFGKVEHGDLKQRLVVTATDEVGKLSVYFNRMISRLDQLQSELEAQVVDRTAQLHATIEVGRVASSILQPDELITRVVNLITDRFGYYYAALFLTDATGRWAELKDATGEAGKTLKSQGHRLEAGGKSMVGTAISTRLARIALDVGAEPVRFENPLLPETRSEIALPLIVGNRVLGALDVQSRQEAAFHPEDIETLQGMANQVAIALENARLYQETQQSLDELRAAHRLYVKDAWSETGRAGGKYEYVASNEPGENKPDGASLSVPLMLREQVIGQLNLGGSQEWTQEERSLIEAVATQAALALENARLLEESQQLALRERLAAEIIGKIWSSPNVDIILQTSIKELGRALRADEATIEIKPE